MSTLQVGSTVSYAETFRGIKWRKIGTVVEMGADRVRVLWSKWVYDSGFEKPDNKRTWVATKKLVLLAT